MSSEKILDVLEKFNNAQLNGGKPFDVLLKALLELTSSEAGYIAGVEFSEDSIGDRNPTGQFLVPMSVEPITSKNYMKEMFKTKHSVFDVEHSTETIITNNFNKYMLDNYGRKPNYTSFHVQITSLAIIPLMHNNKLIGQIGLVNSPDFDVLQELDILIIRAINGMITARLHQCYEQMVVDRTVKQSKNVVLANISHEVRTPLNTILGMNALLLETDLDDNQYECLLVERKSCYHLLGLITDILDINKLEAGKMVFKLMPIDMYELVETSYDLIGFESKRKDLKITYDISPDVPESIVGDKQRIKQMLGNLLSNAVKFTPNGNITTKVEKVNSDEVRKNGLKPISAMHIQPHKKSSTQTILYNEALASDWNYFKFSVEDTGIGIKDDDMPRLFKSYEQLESSNTKKNKGTGLGLAITNELCSLMGGVINVESKIDKGSKFSFIIPLQTYQNPEKELDLSILENKTFLVVDDNEKNLTRLTDLLDSWGVNYRECSSASRALSYVSKPRYKFDLGLLDIIMPVMDGNTLAERISRSDSPFPLVALSSDDGENAVSDFFAHHLTKPYDDKHLLEIIVHVLKLKEMNDTPTDDDSSSHNASTSSSPSSDDKYRRLIAVSSSDDENNIEELDTKCNMAIIKSKVRKSFTNDKKSISGMNMCKESIAETSPRQESRINRAKKFAQHKRMQVDNFYERATNVDINILVVEDQEFNSIMLSKMLKNIGYHKIDFATSGDEAIAMVKANKGEPLKKSMKSVYDLILMDIIMPGKYDGVDASKKIRKLLKYVDKPKIVAVTASVFDGAIDQYLKEGQMDGFITKPIDKIQRITDTLRSLGFC
jgi:signal transduction histidine kinase/DNA-binding response OmpR family regulator